MTATSKSEQISIESFVTGTESGRSPSNPKHLPRSGQPHGPNLERRPVPVVFRRIVPVKRLRVSAADPTQVGN